MAGGYHAYSGLAKRRRFRAKGAMTQDPIIHATELRRAAVHEAGHVLLLRHHQLFIRRAIACDDGSGRASHCELRHEPFDVQLDVILGGPAAECEVLGSRLEPPRAQALDRMAFDFEMGQTPRVKCQDHFEALRLWREQQPTVGVDAMASTLAASHARCCEVVKAHSTAHREVAKMLEAHPNHPIRGDIIDGVLDAAWVEFGSR